MRRSKDRMRGLGSLGAALRAFAGGAINVPKFEVKAVSADANALDRVTSLSLALAERLAPVVADPEAPAQALDTYLGAVREVRAAVQVRYTVTGGLGGGGGGSGAGGPVPGGGGGNGIPVVRIEHSGQYVSDDFNESAPGGARHAGSDLAVPPKPSAS